MRLRTSVLGIFCISAIAVSACHGDTLDDCGLGVCDAVDAGADGFVGNHDGATVDGGGDASDGAPTCDGTKGPSEDPCVVSESVGIFVDGTKGLDANDGTKAAPKKTLAAALTAAKTAGKRVYACEGTYGENVVIDGGVTGVFGGFDCTTWAYDAAKIVGIKPPAGIPLTVKNAPSARFEDVSIEAANAVGQETDGSGRSSIGVFVASSQGVVLRRVNVKAGNGTAGIKGTTGTNYPAGTAAASAIARNGVSNTCTNATNSLGGSGGTAPSSGPPPEGPKPGTAGTSTPLASGNALHNGSGGLAQGATTLCGNGFPGGDGAAEPATNPLTSAGSISSTGWLSAAGVRGGTGRPGQGGGGGGGGGSLVSPVDGGGGGAGGCGGWGGAPGAGGGSSFALLVFNSAVSAFSSVISSAVGGDAAAGTAGQPGQAGGKGFATTCDGGVGGSGAGGGGGGGGAGGLSVAIAYYGAAPTASPDTTRSFAAHGLGGTAGAGGVGGTLAGVAAPPGATGAIGPDGKSAETLELL